jgi:tetratricopeptide (TPR) repeat protein
MISFATCTLALVLYAQDIRAADPDRAGPHIELAASYGSARPLDAIAELNTALKLSPNNKQARDLLRAIAREAALNTMRAGDPQHAFALLVKAHDILPRDPELLYESGFAALEAELYKEAQQLLEETLRVNPTYKDARYALARVYLAENWGPEAEDQMRKYIAAEPTDATAEYGLGYVLVAEQKLDDAKVAFEKSIELQPNQTESLYQLGEIALEQGRLSEARDYFTKVLARDPRHGGALSGIGILAYRAAKYDEACADLERAIAAVPNYQKAHYYYALALSRVGKKADAEREFEISRSLQKHHGATQ